MFSAWFVIKGDRLFDEDILTGTGFSSGGKLWGRRLGGRWCLDYYFKICFGLTQEYWESKCDNLITDKDLYDLFDDIGIAYYKQNDNSIHYKGKLYDKNMKEIKST